MKNAPADSGRLLRRLSRSVLRLGPVGATVLLTAALMLGAIGLSQAAISVFGQGDRVEALLAASVCALVLAPVLGWMFLRLVFGGNAASQLVVLATQDPLTGVHNRRHFMTLAQREWARAQRYGTDAALLLIDADHFRRINESHGHPAGDALLREIARVAAGSLREPDVLARFGGAELVVFLPHTDPLGALDVAERIREHVGELRLPWRGEPIGTTVSIGVAALGASHATLEALVHDADAALQEAKQAGRNCVRAAPIQPRRSGETRSIASS